MENNKYGIDSKESSEVKPSKKGIRILPLFFMSEKICCIKYAPLIISLIYLAFGCMWIFYSDNIITGYAANDVNTLKNLQTYKGWFYVLFTAVMLYFMIKSLVKIIQIKEESRERSYKKLLESENKLKKSMKELKKFAYYDFLTGLPNRRFMLEKIEDILKTSNNIKFSFLFLDLDNFKMVNDIMGHDYGDQLLKNIASELKNCMDESDIVGRLGGDEFLILLSNIYSKDTIENKAKSIMNLFSRQWNICGKEFFITASIGMVIYPFDGTDLQTLYKNADTAMYQAKEKGKNCFLFFVRI